MKTLTKFLVAAVALSGAVPFNVSHGNNSIRIETEVQNPEEILETAGKMVSSAGKAISQITDAVSIEDRQISKTDQTVYRIRSDGDYPATQIGAYYDLNTAINMCPTGYSVYDESETLLYQAVQ